MSQAKVVINIQKSLVEGDSDDVRNVSRITVTPIPAELLHFVFTTHMQRWRKDGTHYYEHNYKDGKMHGVYKKWREDGTPEYELNYKDGEMHGVCRQWSVNGKLIYECDYEEGKCVNCAHGNCE